jgi:1-deoxy-D-xylulose-5-phosphate reductoisomerase
MQQVTILGATGSIGISTLDVIAQHPQSFSVFALTAHKQIDKLFDLCLQFQPCFAVVVDEDLAGQLQLRLHQQQCQTQVLAGEASLSFVAEHPDVDAVMAAIVGAAGLQPTLAAVKAGKKILLANKESLVMAGQLFMDAVKKSGSLLLPIDSEHNAIYQCMPHNAKQFCRGSGVEKLLLTASGGPFRLYTAEQLKTVTPEQACAHPNWSMGRKISVDSATLMNKGLELIEACWLFDTSPAFVDIVIHPQSIIHSMVQYADGSTLAQMGNPDMRTPIAYGLHWPERQSSGVAPLDMFAVAKLDFYRPDENLFPCLRLAKEAFTAGLTAPATLNAANEVAVEAFLAGRLSFVDIHRVIEKVLEKARLMEPTHLNDVLEADQTARRLARELL